MKEEELTSQLRIGNLLTYNELSVHVLGISRNKVELGYFKGSAGFERIITDPHIQPIPLSEEVLLKCPEITPDEWRAETWTIRDPKSQFHIVKMKGRFVFRGLGMSVTYVDTLHHLQNLIYIVTGEELEVSL